MSEKVRFEIVAVGVALFCLTGCVETPIPVAVVERGPK